MKQLTKRSHPRIGSDHVWNNLCLVPGFAHEMPKVVIVSKIVRNGREPPNRIDTISFHRHRSTERIGRFLNLARYYH